MVLYKAVHNTHGFIQYIRMYFDNQCCRSKPVLICMEFYSIRKLNTYCTAIFTYCKNKTKKHSLHNFTVLIIIITIIRKKVATLEKMTVL